MKTTVAIFFVTVLATMACLAKSGRRPSSGQSGAAIAADAQKMFEAKDDLGLRIEAKRLLETQPTLKTWSVVRSLIQSRPGVGWDLILKYDQAAPTGWGDPTLVSADDEIDQADQAMATRRPKKAIELYLKAAAVLSKKGIAFGQPNFFAYQTLLHSLARAYYMAEDFRSALEVDTWISVNYPFIHQIQFEKMWAASRLGLDSITLGAITSQKSSYFSKYLEPETYLLQYYTYRRLCRDGDLKRLKHDILKYKNALDNDHVSLQAWSRRDNETLALFRLIDPTRKLQSRFDIIDQKSRKAEIQAIRSSLEAGYRKDLLRLKDQMKRVVAYLNLATEATVEDLPPIKKIRGAEKILKSGEEMWAVQDGEDWVDEIGKHVFIGVSECKK